MLLSGLLFAPAPLGAQEKVRIGVTNPNMMFLPARVAATYDSTVKAVTQDGAISDDGLRLVIEQAKVELKIVREIPAAEVAEPAPLHQAQKELGLR